MQAIASRASKGIVSSLTASNANVEGPLLICAYRTPIKLSLASSINSVEWSSRVFSLFSISMEMAGAAIPVKCCHFPSPWTWMEQYFSEKTVRAFWAITVSVSWSGGDDKSHSPNSFICPRVLLSTFAFPLFSAAEAARLLIITEVKRNAAREIQSEKAVILNVQTGGK
jgi:hypothetical protein